MVNLFVDGLTGGKPVERLVVGEAVFLFSHALGVYGPLINDVEGLPTSPWYFLCGGDGDG